MKQLLTTIAALVLVGCGSSMSIHKAAGDGNIEAVKQYLDGSADVNAKYVGGWTPLQFAAEKGHKEIAELLIAKGADVNAKMKDGDTPLDSVEYVHESDHSPVERATKKETANLLRKHGGKTAEELKATGNWSTQRTIPMMISQQNKKNSICETN
jgi:ankyrin repeat protein